MKEASDVTITTHPHFLSVITGGFVVPVQSPACRFYFVVFMALFVLNCIDEALHLALKPGCEVKKLGLIFHFYIIWKGFNGDGGKGSAPAGQGVTFRISK